MFFVCYYRVFLGSSPRVRGKLFLGMVFTRARGLIPACAGKTFVFVYGYVGCGAHPRVCGENGLKNFQQIAGFGSSPRVRGKH